MAISQINAASTGQTGTLALTTTGLIQADTWNITSSFSQPGSNVETYVTSNWARQSSAYIGSGMSQSSGVFTFPATGTYLIQNYLQGNATNTSSRYIANTIYFTSNNSSYTGYNTYTSLWSGNAVYAGSNNQLIVNVTDTSLCKVKFALVTESALTVSAYYAQFIRLGNSV